MNTSGLPITQLGSTIKSHLGIAGKYEGKAEEHYKSAGIHILEAKARITSGEYEGKFGAFLLHECGDLSSSRAYELIAVANGTKTVESVRADVRARGQEFRDRQGGVRSQTESTEPHTNQPLSASESAESPKKRGGQAAPQTPEARLTALITKACKGLTADQMNTVLLLIRTF